MEIEKPFKCPSCSACFTNEDHLFVHKHRHEMTLNLKPEPGGQSGQQQQSLDSFVDETPTPTRFFRTCEEVGLFQDLQNVNPFDESFTKAASTPSTTTTATGVDDHQQFDFSNITLPSSAAVIVSGSGGLISGNVSSSTSSEYSSLLSSSKRRYSDHDTLNTPQVFLGGYNLSSGGGVTSTPTATNFSSTTTTVLNPTVPSGGGIPSAGNTGKISSTSRSAGDDEDNNNPQKDQKLLISIPSTPPSSNNKGQNKPKTSLKLNLSPITSHYILSDVPANISADDSSTISRRGIQPPMLEQPEEKKTEILERNRAASSRSRLRRKHWLSHLESRCDTLEKLLAQAKAENEMLRTELSQTLSKHADCSVTKSQQNNLVQLQPTNIISITSDTSCQIIPSSCEETPLLIIPQPKIPAKRGRPRKGQERRVEGIYFPTTMPSSTQLPKVPLLPVTTPVVELTIDE